MKPRRLPQAVPAPTPLTRHLAEQTEVSATPRDAFELAKKTFLSGERIEMGDLADTLGIGRVTLYRWVGSREQLQVEVIWEMALKTLDASVQRTRAKGGPRIARIITDFIRATNSSSAIQAWLEREGPAAMKLMTSSDGHFQPRLAAYVQGLVEEEVHAGRISLPVSTQEFAFILVHVGESYVWRRFITGKDSDISLAEPLLLRLLQ